jgi:zinc protease
MTFLWLGLALAASPTFPIERELLSNGMGVVWIPQPGEATVQVGLFHHVGSALETPEHAGWSHLFEHLLHRGTAAVPDFFAEAEHLGIAFNGLNLRTSTYLWVQGASELLPQLQFLQADRLRHPLQALTPEVLTKEVGRLKDELAGRRTVAFNTALYPEDDPRSLAYAERGFPGVTVDALASYYRQTYSPDRLTWVLIGGFDRPVAERLLEAAVSGIPARQAGPALTPLLPLALDRTETRHVRQSGGSPAVALVRPGVAGAARSELTLATRLLARRLEAKGRTTDSWVDDSVTVLLESPAEGEDPARLARELEDELWALFDSAPPALEEVRAMQLDLVGQAWLALATPSGIALSEVLGPDTTRLDLAAELVRFEVATPTEVLQTAWRWLSRPHVVLVAGAP